MMKKTIFRTVCLLIVFSVFLAFSTPVSALSFDDLPNTDGAKCVYFYNIDAKRIVTKKGGGVKISPASSVKIMTGLLACELLSDRLDETVTITKEMIRATEGTRMKLAEGDKLTARALLYGAVCGGFNDAAYALAAACAGSYTEFVSLMNARAAELGAKDTRFVNPTGYDAVGQYTTLEDVALIAKAAIKNELYMEISSTVSKKLEYLNGKEPFTLHNRNGLIGSYYANGYVNKYAEGMIAGVTDLGGHCVITKATVDDTAYLCIVMGGAESNGRITSYEIANDLISYAKNKLGNVCLMKEGELICRIPVDSALEGAATDENGDYLNVRTLSDTLAFMPLDTDMQGLSYRYHLYSDRLTAPISAGRIVGTLDFYLDGEYLTSTPLAVNADVTENGFAKKMEEMRSAIVSRTTIITLVCLAILLILRQLYFNNHKRKKVTELRLKRYGNDDYQSNRGKR